VEFLKWHSLHDASSKVALVCLGLHLGLNWSLMVASLRKLIARRAERTRAPKKPTRLQPLIVPLAIILSAVTILGAGLWAVERVMPAGDVTIIQRDGRRIEHAPPPPDIVRLRPDEVAPNRRGLPAFILQSVLVAVSAVAGRQVLRLRLD